MFTLKGQSDVFAPVPMPIDNTDTTVSVGTSTAETVTWFYVTSSAWASATGQAAGTIVFGKLTYKGVLNSNKAAIGSFNNTSLSLGASTRLDVRVSIPEDVLSAIQTMSPTDQKATVAKYLTTNGYYCIDHRRGEIWGIQKATVANDTATYNYWLTATGGTIDTNITQVGGVADPTAGGDAASNTRTDVPVSARISGFNGTTWDRVRVGVTTPTATMTGFENVLPWAVYNATPTVRTEAQGGPLQANTNGALNVDEVMAAQAEDNTNGVLAVVQKPLAASTYAPTRFQNLGANATLNVKATTGNVFSVHCHNLNAADRYIQLHNTATTPAGAAVPLYTFRVPAGGNTQIGTEFFTLPGVNFSTGIAFSFSTTEATYTAATAGDQITQILFI